MRALLLLLLLLTGCSWAEPGRLKVIVVLDSQRNPAEDLLAKVKTLRDRGGFKGVDPKLGTVDFTAAAPQLKQLGFQRRLAPYLAVVELGQGQSVRSVRWSVAVSDPRRAVRALGRQLGWNPPARFQVVAVGHPPPAQLVGLLKRLRLEDYPGVGREIALADSKTAESFGFERQHNYVGVMKLKRPGLWDYRVFTLIVLKPEDAIHPLEQFLEQIDY